MADDSGIYAAYLALGVQALLPIFLGSFKSLKVSLLPLASQQSSSATGILELKLHSPDARVYSRSKMETGLALHQAST